MEIIRDTGTPPSPPQSHRCPSSQTANRFSHSRCTSSLLDPAKSPSSISVRIVCLVSFLPSPRTCLGEAGRTRKILSAALCDVTIPSVVVSADLAWFPLGATHLRKSLTHSWHMHPQDCRPPLRSNSPTTRQTACSVWRWMDTEPRPLAAHRQTSQQAPQLTYGWQCQGLS